MITIALTQGKVALIDDEDFERVSKFKWTSLYNPNSKKWYARRAVWNKGNQKTIYLHRYILNAPKGLHVDHINGNGLDNQKKNLRLATNAENHQNQIRSIISKSGFRGVSFDKRKIRNKFYARIYLNGRRISLGYFLTAAQAARAYDEAAVKLHGKFARLNFKRKGHRKAFRNKHAAAALSLHVGLARQRQTV